MFCQFLIHFLFFSDNFNIPTPESSLNYYKNYTEQGSKHPHSYLYTEVINGDKYGFLGIDACLTPGPKRPFNFVGMLNKSESLNVKHLIQKAKKDGECNEKQFLIYFSRANSFKIFQKVEGIF